jgi:ribosomal-protein-alanine N-acetyltransferase
MIAPSTDAALLARLHALALDRGWGESDYAASLAMPAIRAWVSPVGDPQGFVLVSKVGAEIEVLMLAVAPLARRQGLARALLGAALAQAKVAFLDVATDNHAAIALYRGLGFVEIGRRLRYYTNGADALALRWTAPSHQPISAPNE